MVDHYCTSPKFSATDHIWSCRPPSLKKDNGIWSDYGRLATDAQVEIEVPVPRLFLQFLFLLRWPQLHLRGSLRLREQNLSKI
jgi:hypothetical protein